MKRMKGIIISLTLVVVFAVLSGCVTDALVVKNGSSNLGEKFDLTIHPEQAIGIRVTPALAAGKVTVIECPMPDGQVAIDMFGGRFNFPGWFSNDSHQEGYAQFALSDNYQTGELMSLLVIDGVFSEVKSGRVLPLSSRIDFTFDKYGTPVPIDRVRFRDEEGYRNELSKAYGVPVGDRRLVEGFVEMIKSWNLFETEFGDIYSPFSQEFIAKEIAAKTNLGYTQKGRLVLKNIAVISINPVEMITKASLTVYRARKYDGFNPNHIQMAKSIDFLVGFRMELIRELNLRIAAKDAEIASLKSEKKERGR